MLGWARRGTEGTTQPPPPAQVLSIQQRRQDMIRSALPRGEGRRAEGVHGVVGTQRPGDVIPPGSRQGRPHGSGLLPCPW